VATVWIAEPAEAELTDEEVHRKGIELAERTLTAGAEIWPEIFASLTEEGKALFVVEILEAGRDAQGDPEPIARVAEAWWRTLQARASYSKNLKRVGKGRVYSASELKAALKVPE
jgi:hypothetical protein